MPPPTMPAVPGRTSEALARLLVTAYLDYRIWAADSRSHQAIRDRARFSMLCKVVHEVLGVGWRQPKVAAEVARTVEAYYQPASQSLEDRSEALRCAVGAVNDLITRPGW
jgi:hypothetical protein